jgi:hypothetical protein
MLFGRSLGLAGSVLAVATALNVYVVYVDGGAESSWHKHSDQDPEIGQPHLERRADGETIMYGYDSSVEYDYVVVGSGAG